MAEELPPVFQEALEDTGIALRLWKEAARKMGAGLVILATHTLQASGLPIPEQPARQRGVKAELMLKRLQAIAQREDIQVIDQADYILRRGGDIKKASFAFDGHWNHYGHKTASEAIAEWLRSHPEYCQGASKNLTAKRSAHE